MAAAAAVAPLQTLAHDFREEVEQDIPSIGWLPNEMLLIIISQLDGKTLMVSIPQVCKLWRSVCQDVENVHLDFSWWREKDKGNHVPVEVLSGWRLITVGANRKGWKTGLCELFPRTTSITMQVGLIDEDPMDAHLLALANKCHGMQIAHVYFRYCKKLTDAAVIALADKGPGITHVNFWGSRNLTDAAVIALADGTTHSTFGAV